jgi:hypothetical protein
VIRPALSRRVLVGAALAALARPAAARERTTIAFDGLYKSFGVRGLEFSDRVRQLVGQTVAITGYMAPPLKAESNFFVLSSEPLALCPFCQSDADWPVDIVVIYLAHVMPLISAGTRITVQGRLEAGSWLDPDSGFVSLLRLMDADYRQA